MPAPNPDKVLLGQFGAAHGIRGEIKINSYTEEPAGIADYGPFTLDDGRVVEIAAIRVQGDVGIGRVVIGAGVMLRCVAQLQVEQGEVGTRDQAEGFAGRPGVGNVTHLLDQPGNARRLTQQANGLDDHAPLLRLLHGLAYPGHADVTGLPGQ